MNLFKLYYPPSEVQKKGREEKEKKEKEKRKQKKKKKRKRKTNQGLEGPT